LRGEEQGALGEEFIASVLERGEARCPTERDVGGRRRRNRELLRTGSGREKEPAEVK